MAGVLSRSIARFAGLCLVSSMLGSVEVLSDGMSHKAVAETLSDSVAKPLQQAQAALAAHNFTQANAAIRNAWGAKGKTDYDIHIIQQMQAAIASASGDLKAAIAANKPLLQSKYTSKQEKISILFAQASLAYRLKNYPETVESIKSYFAAGGDHPNMYTLLIQAYYLQKDYVNAIHTQQQQIQVEEKKGLIPAESQYLILAASQRALKQEAALINTYTNLVTHYPKPEYWKLLMGSLVNDSAVPRSLQFDLYRLKWAAGLLNSAPDYMDAAEHAVEAGLLGIAQRIIEDGYQRNILGNGPEAARQQRFKNYIAKRIVQKKAEQAQAEADALKAPNGDDLLNVGHNYILFGQSQKGLELMKQAMQKQLSDKNAALLHMAMGQLDAGKKDLALQTLKETTGQNIASELAHVWVKLLSPHIVKHEH